MSDNTSTSLLRRFHDEWQPFWNRIEALDAAALRTLPANGEWPFALTLAHCARWEDWTFASVNNHVYDGAAPSMAGVEHWNDQWAAEDRDVTPEDARSRLGEAHERLAALIESLHPDQWDDVVRRTIDFCTFHHYSEHIGDLPA